MSSLEPTREVQSLYPTTVCDSDKDDGDVKIIGCDTAPGSAMPPVSVTFASPCQQQQRQPRLLLKQNAFNVSQEWSMKFHSKSPASSEKAASNRSNNDLSQWSKHSRRLTHSFDPDYMFRHSQDPSDTPRQGVGTRSLDKCYLRGLNCSPHEAFIPKTTSNAVSPNSASVTRIQSSQLSSEFEVPMSFPNWGSVGGVHRQKFQSLDDSCERLNRLRCGEALHVACRRAFSEHLAPFGYLRDFSTSKRGSHCQDNVMEESQASGNTLAGFSWNIIQKEGSHDSKVNVITDSNLHNGHVALTQSNMAAAKSSPVLVGAAKRKGKPSMEQTTLSTASSHNQLQHQNLLMMAAHQGISQQQLQHVLQQGLPQSLQQLIQQQSLVLQQVQHQKLHEQLLHSLNDQLQLNLMHQAQLMKDSSGKTRKPTPSFNNHSLQALLMQHQQIMQQIQLVQRQFTLASILQPLGMHQGMMSPAELQLLWKEVSQSTGENGLESANGISTTTTNSNSGNNYTTSTSNGSFSKLSTPTSVYIKKDMDSFNMPGMKSDNSTEFLNSSPCSSTSSKDGVANDSSSSNSSSHPLYINRCCKWPNCEARLEEMSGFVKVVYDLAEDVHQSVNRNCGLILTLDEPESHPAHLNTDHQLDDRSTAQSRVQMEVVSSLETQLAFQRKVLKAMTDHLHQQSLIPLSAPSSHPQPTSASMATHHISSSLPSSIPSSRLSPKSPHDQKPECLLPQVLSKPTMLNLFSGFIPPVSMVPSPIIALPPSHRPPSLVSTPGGHSLPSSLLTTTCSSSHGSSEGGGPFRRRVSDKCNLPISAEIQRNREFYKNTGVRPPFTYASLIRQAIIESPHRQLTLNEIYQWFQTTFAYFRRNEATWKNAVRHNLSLHKCFMRVENVKGAVWTVDEIEFYKRRPQKLGPGTGNVKTPSLNDVSYSYNETVSASLRAALRHGIGSLRHEIMQDQESAEDLSLKGMGHNGFSSRRFDEADLMMRIKKEVQEAYPDMDMNNPQAPPRRMSASPQHNNHDLGGVEVRDHRMIMMYDEQEEASRMEEEAEEERADMDDRERAGGSADYEDSSRELDERQHLGNDEDESSLDRPGIEMEAEQELRAMQIRFEHEQTEYIRREYSGFKNGFDLKRTYPGESHGMSMPTRLFPLCASDKRERQRHHSDGGHYHGHSISDEDKKLSSQCGTMDVTFFVSGNGKERQKITNKEATDGLILERDNSVTRPFVIQLPDSGPVFPTPYRQTKST